MPEVTLIDQVGIVGALAKGRSPMAVASRVRRSVAIVEAVGKAHGYPDLGKLEAAHASLQEALGRAKVVPGAVRTTASAPPATTAAPPPEPRVASELIERAKTLPLRRVQTKAARAETLLRELAEAVHEYEARDEKRAELEAEIAKHQAKIKHLRAQIRGLS